MTEIPEHLLKRSKERRVLIKEEPSQNHGLTNQETREIDYDLDIGHINQMKLLMRRFGSSFQLVFRVTDYNWFAECGGLEAIAPTPEEVIEILYHQYVASLKAKAEKIKLEVEKVQKQLEELNQ